MKYILNIFLITLISFGSFAQESDPGVDHEIGTWQFRQIDPGDVANFLSNEDKVYRKFVKNAIDDGRMKHWGLLRKVTGNTSMVITFSSIMVLRSLKIWILLLGDHQQLILV